jgi:hypothetical protein
MLPFKVLMAQPGIVGAYTPPLTPLMAVVKGGEAPYTSGDSNELFTTRMEPA